MISGSGCYNESISSFLATICNHLLRMLNLTLRTFGLYPRISHGEGIASHCKFLETRDNKHTSNNHTSEELGRTSEVVLKNDIFEFAEKTFKQKRGTTI